MSELGDACRTKSESAPHGSCDEVEREVAILEDAGRGPGFRAAAARSLGAKRAEGATRPLIEAMDDRSERVRFAACSALVELRTPESGERLHAALADTDRGVRLAAARGLGYLAWKPARLDLLKALDADDLWLRLRAAEALVAIGEPQLRDLIAPTLRKERWRPFGGRRKFWKQLMEDIPT